MSLFRGTIRPPAILSDEAVERYLAAIREELAPDPLFRRRLRGDVMNRFVAAREGLADAVPQRRPMGKLGRAVLYASFTLALSATSVLAVSQAALPGDPLYPLKRQVEDLRMEVLPAHFHHDLAAYQLAERIDELARLTELGDTTRAAALAAVVAADYEAFLAESDAVGVAADNRYFTVLSALIDRLPETAQDAIRAVVDRAPSHGLGSAPDPGSTTSNGSEPGVDIGVGIPGVPGLTGNGSSDPADVQPTPRPTRSPKPEPTPRESRGPHAGPDAASSGGEPQPSADDDQDDDEYDQEPVEDEQDDE